MKSFNGKCDERSKYWTDLWPVLGYGAVKSANGVRTTRRSFDHHAEGNEKSFLLWITMEGKRCEAALYWLCDDTSGWMDRRKKRAGPWWLFTIVDISTGTYGAPTGPAPISIAVNPHSSRIRESVLSAWWKRSVISIGRSRISRWWAKKFLCDGH